MTAAAVMARETALADIRRRGVSNHPYQTDLPSIASLRKAHPQTQRRACEDVAAELTAWDRDTRRHGVAESTLAAAGLAEVLLLIVRGHREIGLHEIAAIMRGHRNTAQGVISRLCADGTTLLWRKQLGRKNECMTTYALAPKLVEMLTEALARAQAWTAGRKAARQAFEASGRKATRRSQRESTSSGHRVSPPSVGEAFKAASSDSGPARGRVGQAIDHARALAVALGRTGEECEHDTVPSRCGICRHRTGNPAAVP